MRTKRTPLSSRHISWIWIKGIQVKIELERSQEIIHFFVGLDGLSSGASAAISDQQSVSLWPTFGHVQNEQIIVGRVSESETVGHPFEWKKFQLIELPVEFYGSHKVPTRFFFFIVSI